MSRDILSIAKVLGGMIGLGILAFIGLYLYDAATAKNIAVQKWVQISSFE